jgi:hypothetical protein
MKRMFPLRILLVILIAISVLSAAEEECKCEKDQHLLITGTIPGGAAETAGIESGDIIVSYDKHEVHCLKKLNALKEAVKTDSVEIVIKRDGEVVSYMIPEGMIGIYVKELLPDIEFEKDAVVIKGIGRLDWDTGETSSFVASLARVAEYLNVDRDYTYLMGASGSAFRIQFHADWCPSSPDATVGYDCGAAAMRSINLIPSYMFLDREEGTNKGEILKGIVKSIDEKMPVIAIDLIEVPEWGLIVGHQKGGEELIVRDYFDRRQSYDNATKFPWVVVTLSQKEGAIDDAENFKKSLEIAQELYETETYESYYSGITALEYWIKRLKEDDFAALDDEKFEEVVLSNAWIFSRLADDRMFGAEYLKSFAPKFPQVKDNIVKLASLYESINELMTTEEMIAPYPMQIEKRDDWTPEMRNKELEILAKVLEKEKEAYTLVKETNKILSVKKEK